MTIALEHIQEGDWAALNRAVDALRSLVLDTGGRSLGMRIGSDTLTFTASATSAARTVAHGLGRIPTAMFAQAMGGAAFCFIQVNSFDATNVVFQGHDVDAAVRTGNNTYFWVVIG